MFVHDFNQFVLVQQLEETIAVQSLGKLCKDHGYSFEWVSVQKPRLTKEGKGIICKKDNFVPLVVPGFQVNSTSPPQDSSRREVEIASGNSRRSASSSSSGPMFERSDEVAPASKKSEEREFVVYSGASMHMVSKK